MSATQGTSIPSARPFNFTRWGLYLAGLLTLAGLFARVTGRTYALVQEAASAASIRRTEQPPVRTPVATLAAALNATGNAKAPTPALTLPAAPSATPLAGATSAPATPAATTIASNRAGCALYDAGSDLLTRVDRDAALPREFEPDDLATVPLNPKNAYYGPLLLRRTAHQPLLDMLEAMNQPDLGLQIMVISGYRSYSDQALAYEKWLERYPDRGSNISAVPGHSEHQIGTALDFSTPYMEGLFGEQFHPQFFYTKEGQWLSKNSASFGFVMSYPSWGVEQTGYEWEPWHYRYVGTELAKELFERHITVSEYIKQCSSGT